MTSIVPKNLTILSDVTSTGVGNTINTEGWRHCIICIGTSGSANATVKVKGTVDGINTVAFGSAASRTNLWDFIQAINLNSGASVAGDTGVVFSGTDSVEMYELNINGIKSFTLDVTAYSAGTIRAIAYLSNNQ